ncbi:hypothetical protein STRUR_0161 [Streptococcus urinalis 2285-97]|uniref:Uncharacterized protein n=2 Tax=Streptococcus urinalis TaxID=149016 RepID=G5KH69_9STRE|nr:hypothetical protein STRUR_0161 [Streptococcus urinalis 2285-97]
MLEKQLIIILTFRMESIYMIKTKHLFLSLIATLALGISLASQFTTTANADTIAKSPSEELSFPELEARYALPSYQKLNMLLLANGIDDYDAGFFLVITDESQYNSFSQTFSKQTKEQIKEKVDKDLNQFFSGFGPK